MANVVVAHRAAAAQSTPDDYRDISYTRADWRRDLEQEEHSPRSGVGQWHAESVGCRGFTINSYKGSGVVCALTACDCVF